jgi:hypothetical protein
MEIVMTTTEITNANLTDTQLVILSSAARRKSRAMMPFPKSLKAKDAALAKAINKLIRPGLAEERPVKAKDPVWRRDGEDQPLGLFLTDAGLIALDGPANGSKASEVPTLKPKTEKSRAGSRSSRMSKQTTAGTRRPGSKQDKVLKLLRLKGGVTLPDICSQTGWQAHSARGFLSGTVRKKLGLTLVSEKDADGVRCYRIGIDDAPTGK